MCGLLLLIAEIPVFGQTGDRFLYQSAEQRFRTGDYAVALERYEQFLREHPTSELVPDVQFRRAVTLYQLGRYQESADLFARVQTRYRSTRFLPYVPFYLGVSQFQLGQYSRAADNLSAVQVRDQAVQNEARLYLARSRIALGDAEEAREILRDLLNAPGESVRGFAGALYVSLLHGQQEYQQILEIAEQLSIDSLPAQWADQVRLFQAEALFFLDEFELARELFETLTESRLEIATVAFQRLFLIMQEIGSQEDVAAVIRRAEQVLAGRSEVLKDFWTRVGLSSFQNQEYRLAELYLRRVWDLRGVHEVSEIVPLYLAEIAEIRGDYEQGIRVLSEFVERESGAVGLFRLSTLQAKQGLWQEARENTATFRRLHSRSELFPQASYLHAFVLVQLEDYDDALRIVRDLHARGLTSGIQEDLLRLEAQIHRQTGNGSAAIESFRDYLALRPDDIPAVVEYVTVLFEQERYAAVDREVETLLEQLPGLGEAYPQERAKLFYLRGLSAVTAADFRTAVEFFAPVSQLATSEALGLGEDVAALHPYNLFYHAWSYYQQGNYRDSLRLFSRIPDEYPAAGITPRAVYLAGWSAFADGEYATAQSLLQRISAFDPEPALAADAGYLLAQTQIELGEYQQAISSYRGVFLDFPDSSRAREARFGFAEALLRADRVESALEAFAEVTNRYPDSYLGQEALYRRAQVQLERDNLRVVQELLFEYRTSYPAGDRIDDALFIGGEIAEQLGEPSGALLLWNRLVEEHRDSPHRFDAMMNAARIYRQRGEHRTALNLVSEARARYPQQAAAAGADRIADELVLQVSGVSEREAELRVQIEQNEGAATRAGREAILELGRTVLLEAFTLDSEAERVVPQLQQVATRDDDAPDQAAEAHFLLGEYFMRTDRPARAADAFLDAAATVAADRDLLARSLYRGAEALIRDSRPREAEQLVQRIQDSFPQTQWSEAAERLLED